jgi:hypothetical protein
MQKVNHIKVYTVGERDLCNNIEHMCVVRVKKSPTMYTGRAMWLIDSEEEVTQSTAVTTALV